MVIVEDFFSYLHRCIADAAAKSLTLQDTAVDVVEHDTPISYSTVVTLRESALSWLTQNEGEI